MAKIIGGPVASRYQGLPNIPEEKIQIIATENLDKGMFSVLDPANIPDGGLVNAQNVRVRYLETERRVGHSPFTTQLPVTAYPIVKIAQLRDVEQSATYIIVFTSVSIYIGKVGVGGVLPSTWTLLTDSILPCTHARTASDRIQGIGILASASGIVGTQAALYVFCDNGRGPVRFINTFPEYGTVSATTQLFHITTITGFEGGTLFWSPRFVTTFYNRIVVANFVTFDGVTGGPYTLANMMAWSGDFNYAVWDPTVDPSAGSSPISESPEDQIDPITGIQGFSNIMIVLREHSIWHATKQPIASSPFYFTAAVPSVGCDCPYTVARVPSGLIWLDTRSRTVWAYTIGQYGYANLPEPIGRPIETSLLDGVSNKDTLEGYYDPKDQEYHLLYPDIDKEWIYSLKSKAWTNDVLGDAYTAMYAEPTVENYVYTGRYIGSAGGRLLYENPNNVTTDDATTYTSLIESREYTLKETDMYVVQIRIEYQTPTACLMYCEYSRDGGVTWEGLRAKNLVVGKPHLFIYYRKIKARRLRFRFYCSNGQPQWMNPEVHVYTGPKSRDNLANRS